MAYVKKCTLYMQWRIPAWDLPLNIDGQYSVIDQPEYHSIIQALSTLCFCRKHMFNFLSALGLVY